MSLQKQDVLEALRSVRVPGSSASLADSAFLRHAAACDGHVSLRLSLVGVPPPMLDQVARAAERGIRAAGEATGDPLLGLVVEFVDERSAVIHTSRFGASAAPQDSGGGHKPIGGLADSRPAARAQNPQDTAGPLPGVRHVIAVGAGKGGVGKSTIAVNLAVALARKGHAVGLMDGDIYGPSLPTMLALHSLDTTILEGRLQPFYVHGVKAMTIGRMVDPEKPLIWRGPMAHGAFKQLVEQTNWGELDYLVIDLPPGTGDVSLTMAQLLRLTGAVVVCTPQRVAQDDAVRAARMFQQLGIEVLGVVENMSFFIGDDGKEYDIFGRGGAEKMAARLGVPFLGAVPITMALRENSDSGDPGANFDRKRNPALSAALSTLAEHVEKQASLAAVRQGQTRPTLTIS
jgi:ATP-binding protein involved in chromosome partitioning